MINDNFLDTKLLNSFNINVGIGSFALDKSPLMFETCRERFAGLFQEDIDGFYLKIGCNQSNNVAQFIWKTESILNVDKSKFSLTNYDTVLWVEPSYFWKKCPLKRSLYTIFLRSGNDYFEEKDNYEEALFRHEYVAVTKKAVMRFLFGYTKYVGLDQIQSTGSLITRGWKAIFQGMDEKNIKTSLICPEKSQYNPQILIPNALWQ